MVDGRRWYRGDCHVHSSRSAGADLQPDQLVVEARAAGLDFIATTEHNTVDGHSDCHADVTGGLLVILGQEVVTAGGHWLALGIDAGLLVDWRYQTDDGLNAERARVHGCGGLAVVAHPYAPYPTGTFQYSQDGFDLVEVWNGRWSSDLVWQADNEAALKDWGRSLAAAFAEPTDAGESRRWRPAIGNSDVHRSGQIGVPHTVVLADEFTAAAVLAGLRAGRSWIAGSATVALSVTASAGRREAGIGERLACAGEPVTVRVEVAGVPGGRVSLHNQRGEVHREPIPDSGSAAVRWTTSARDSAFVRIEVRRSDGDMAALSNPIVLA